MTADATLRGLATGPGPVTTVYLATSAEQVPAGPRAERQWHPLRSALAEQGAPDGALDPVEPLLADAHLEGRGICVIAGADGVHHVEHLPDEPAGDHAWWEPFPALLPLIKRRQSEPPYVVVLTDRRGADITVAGHETDVVQPEDEAPISKVAPGGWSQRRYQQRAENTWEAHAREVADHVQRAVDAVRAEIVLVGGDVRAVQLLESHLPERVLQRVEAIHGGRAHDGSEDEVAEETRRWVQTAAARRIVAVLERFREEIGQHDKAVEGVGPTREALAIGQVATLLVHDDWLDDRRVPLGDDDLPHAAGDGTARLLDVVIRDALRTDAGVVVVPRNGGPKDGVGALLRWPAGAGA